MLNHLQATFIDTNLNTTPDNAEAMTGCLANTKAENRIMQSKIKLADVALDPQLQSSDKKVRAKVIAIKKEPSYDFVGVAG